MEIEGIIQEIIPKRGRGPGVLRVSHGEETLELTTFDPALLQVAAGSVGMTATLVYDEKLSKAGDKTYRNLTKISLSESATANSSEGEIPPTTSMLPQKPAGHTPYVLFDRADDEAIIAKLKGQIVKAYVYCFKQQGNMVYGLGVDGAEACKRELARHGEIIEEESVDLIKDDNAQAYFQAKASRWAVNMSGHRVKLDTALGYKRVDKFMSTGGRNPFWFEQGASKSMRNAILRLTPEEIKARLVEMYKDQAKEVIEEETGSVQGKPAFIRRE